MDWKLFNVVFLGLSFMLLFTAFQTCSMVEQTVIKDAQLEPNSTFSGSGYTSLAIVYGIFSASNWAAPSIVASLGPKLSMIGGGILYCLFLFSFLKPMTWALYLGSVLVGLGAAVLWTAQGNFLTLNSDPDTMGRNSGIFWALLQFSLLFGNLYTYFAFGGEANINKHTRITLFTVLTSLGAAGVIAMLILRSGVQSVDGSVNTAESNNTKKRGPLQAFKHSIHLMCTKEIILLSFGFAYTGFELSFWSGVYGTCVGATGYFGDEAKSLIGLTGILVGVGEIFGGSLFGLMGKRTIRYGRDPIVLIGYLTHVVAAFLIFISLPQDSPLVSSSCQPTYITPNKYIILLCAFLFGFGDSSFNTQIYSLLGFLYSEDSAPAFALYKFIQSLASAIAFVYSDYLLLQWQLFIIIIFGTVGTCGFFVVEYLANVRHPSGYSPVTEDIKPESAE